MTQTEIKVGPIRPTTGPLAQLGGAAASQPLGGGSLPDQIEELRQAVLSIQDQLLAQSQLLNRTISVPMLVGSGDNHQPGVVPDPGATAGTTNFLREDATFAQVSATGLTGILPVVNGGTGTATGSITGTGDLTFTAGGSNKTASLVSSGTGKVVLKPGTDSTTAIQAQNAAGVAILDVDTTNGRVGIGATAEYSELHVKSGASGATTALNGDTVVFAEHSSNAYYEIVAGATKQAGVILGSNATNNSANIVDVYDATNPYLQISANLANSHLRLYTTGLERVRVDKTGNVGIGATAPTSALQVVGIPVYANNAAAVGGGLTAGAFYRTGADPDPVCVVH